MKLKKKKTDEVHTGLYLDLKPGVGFAEQGLELDILGAVTLHAVVPRAVKECQVRLPQLM